MKFSQTYWCKEFVQLFLCLCSSFVLFAANDNDTTQTSTREQAIAFVDKISELQPSIYWPHIKPALFLHNLKENVHQPLLLYEGTNTNFCGYAALSYLFMHDDPLGYTKLMLQLYTYGKAKIRNVSFQPSQPIKDVAGNLHFKGALDIRPVEQMWFLCLADHFKGYLNFLNTHYDPGDENKLWASVNYGKFNRMAKRLFNYKVNAAGSDLMRPYIHDMYEYLVNSMKQGITVLYLNNTILRKKYDRIKANIPSHYVILLDIQKVDDDLINITYWDYGFRTMRQLTPSFLNKIIFGISQCTIKKANEK
ncbi:MAG: hypothetical protein JST87_07170 [Bacteroidetes bacterium]|nr:hypothetical protein [Bacteroidota bacterium]